MNGRRNIMRGMMNGWKVKTMSACEDCKPLKENASDIP